MKNFYPTKFAHFFSEILFLVLFIIVTTNSTFSQNVHEPFTSKDNTAGIDAQREDVSKGGTTLRDVPERYKAHPEYGKTKLANPDMQNSYELIQERTIDSRLFQNPDGSFTAVKAGEPMHYKDADGWWRTIDVTFEQDAIKPQVYNLNKQRLPMSFDSKSGVVSMKLDSVNSMNYGDDLSFMQIDNGGNVISKKSINSFDASVDLKKANANITNVFDGINMVLNFKSWMSKTNYMITSRSLINNNAEWVVFKEKVNVPSNWVLEYDKENGTLKDGNWQGDILVKNTNGDVKSKFKMPIYCDSGHDRNINNITGTYKIEKIDNSTYYLCLMVPASWLLAPERVFPVTLDPMVPNDDPTVIASCLFPSYQLSNLSVGVGVGNTITNTYLLWEFTAVNYGIAWMEDQRSYVTGSNGSTSVYYGAGQTFGTETYSLNSTIGNGAATGTATYQFYDARVWGGSACDVTYNYINRRDIEVTFFSGGCNNFNNFHSNVNGTGFAPCGSYAVTTTIGPGQHQNLYCCLGSSYTINTCGTYNTPSFDTQISGYQGGSAVLFYNDDNGATCTGNGFPTGNSYDSWVDWTSSVNGWIQIQVTKYTCLAWAAGSTSAILRVKENPPPTPAAPTLTPAGGTYCTGSYVLINAVGSPPTGISWYWQTSPTGTSTANGGINYAVSTSGTYYLRPQSCSGCWGTASAGITVTFYPGISNNTISTNQTICAGTAPSTIVGSAPSGGLGAGTYNYGWEQSTDGGLTWGNCPAPNQGINYSPTALFTTTRYRRWINSGPCPYLVSNDVIITVQPGIDPGIIANDQSICYNTIPSGLNGSPPSGGTGLYTYQWQQQPGCSGAFSDIAGANSFNYNFPGNLIQTTCYIRRVSSGVCPDVYSNIVTVTVYADLYSGSVDANQAICFNSIPVGFNQTSAASGGTGSYAYQWQIQVGCSGGWSDLPLGTGASYSYPSNLLQTCCFRRRVISGICNPVYTNTITVTVYDDVTPGTVAASQSICYNTSPATFTNVALPSGGVGVYDYQWQQQTNCFGAWSDITGATSSTLSYPSNLIQTTCFRRRVINMCNTVYSNILTVTIYPNLTPGSVGDNQFICYNTAPNPFNNIQLPTGGTGPFSYQWQEQPGCINAWSDIGGATASTYNYSSNLIQTTCFRRVVINACGSVSSSPITVTVYGNLTPGSIASNQSICYNFIPATFTNSSSPTGGAGNYSYQWQIQPGCVGPWANIPFANSNIYSQPTPLIQNTCYRRQVTDLCGGPLNSNIVSVTVYPLTSVSFTGLAGPYCIDQSTPVTLIGNPPGGIFTGNGIQGSTFVPYFAAVGNNVITYTFTDGNGCVNSQSQTVIVTGLPVVSFTGLAGPYCVNSSTPVPLTGFPPNGIFSGPGISGNNFIPSMAGSGYFQITYTYHDANGCTNSNTQSVLVSDLPLITFNGLASSYCINSPGVILVGFPAGGVFSGPGITGSLFTPSAAGTGGKTIIYTYTNGFGCTNTTSQNTTVNPLPVVSFSGLLTNYCFNNPPAVLTGTPAGGTFSGTGISGNSFYPSISGIGTFNITYTYINGNNCTNSQTKPVTVTSIPVITSPDTIATCSGQNVNYTIISSLPGSSFTWTASLIIGSATGYSSGSGNVINNILINNTLSAALVKYVITPTAPGAPPCTGAPFTLIVNVRPYPTLFAGNNATTCSNVPYTVSDATTDPSNTINWTTSGLGTFIDASLMHPTYTPSTSESGNIDLIMTVTNPLGCPKSDTVTLTINYAPIANAGSDQTISCGGSGTAIGSPAQPNYIYNWSPTIGLNNPNIADPLANPMANTTYGLTVTNTNNGCFDTDDVVITVSGAPVANAGPDQSINCGGAGVVIGSAAIGGMGYNWSPVNGLSNPNIAQPTATPLSNTTYTLTITDLATGCYATDNITITVIGAPTANAGPDQSVNCGGNIGVVIGSSAISGMSYNWLPTAGLSNPNVAQPTANPLSNTTYVLTVTDMATGCYATDNMVLTVIGAPIADAGLDQSISCGGSIGIPIGTPGISGLSYNWLPSTGLNDPNIAQPNANPLSNTTYHLIVTDLITGCYATDEMTITVVGAPIANAGIDQSINCGGTGTTIGSSSVGGMAYSWSPSNSLSNANIAQPTATPLGNTTYTVTVTDLSSGCYATDNVTITVIGAPVAAAGLDQSINCGGAGTIIGSPFISGMAYTWIPSTGLNNPNIAQPTATPLTPTNYTLIVTDMATGCYATDNISISVIGAPLANAGPNQTIGCGGPGAVIGTTSVPGMHYTWSPTYALSGNSIAQPTATPLGNTTYYLTVTNTSTGCYGVDSVTITVSGAPVANAGVDQTINCGGAGVTIGSTSVSGMAYNWIPSYALVPTNIAQPTATPLGNTSYYLNVTDMATGCFGTDMVTINVLGTPPVNAGLNQAIACGGPGVVIGTNGIGGVGYTWTPVTGLSSSIIDKPFALPYVTTNYVVTATDMNTGCFATDNVLITVVGVPSVYAGSDTSVCANTIYTITDATSSNSFVHWTHSGVGNLANNTTLSPTYHPLPNEFGTVTLTLTAVCNTDTATDNMLLTVFPYPIATFSELDSAYCIDNPGSLLIGYPAGGTFSGAGISGDYFTPASAGVGIHSIDYIYTDVNGCTKDTTKPTIVNPLPVVSFTGLNANYCPYDAGYLTGTPPGGIFSGPGVVGSLFYASVSGVGTFTVTYTFEDSNGCISSQSQQTTVTALAAVNFFGLAPEYCAYDPVVTLVGLPVGGTFSGPGINGNDFDPSAAGVGTHTINYSYSDAYSCVNDISKTVIVHEIPLVSISNLNSSYCINSSPQLLAGYPVGGTFSGPGITGSTFNPSQAGAGNHVITYTFMDVHTCVGSISLSVVVFGLTPTSFTGLNPSYCINDMPVPLIGNPAGGTFSGTGIVNDFFYPSISGAGTYNITYTKTDINGCTNSSTQSVIVHPLTPVSFTGLPAQYCLNGTPISLVGNPTGGTFSGAGITGSTFNPTTAGVGNHIITFSYTDGFNCTNQITHTVNVLPLPVVNFIGLSPEYCIDAPNDTLIGFPTGGTFSGAGITGNIFDASAAGAGSHVITYSFTDGNACTNTFTRTVIVHDLPVVSQTPFADVCPNYPQFTLTGGSPSGGTYSGAGVSNNIFNPSVAGAGVHPITYAYMDTNSCVNTATQPLTVNSLPVLTITGLSSEYCLNAPSDVLTGTPNNGYFIGAGISGNVFNPSVANVGIHDIGYVFTDGLNCTDTLIQTIEVLALPHIAISGIDTAYCINEPVVYIGGFPVGGTFSGAGISGNTFTPSVAGVGFHNILYAYTDTSTTCTDTIIFIVNVHGLPNLTLTPFSNVCLYDTPFTLINGSPVGGSYSGAGVTGGIIFNPFFAGSGTHLITYSYKDSIGCINTISDSIKVNTNPTVNFDLGFTEICSNDYPVLLSGGTPLGGTYSGPGVNDSLFTPSLAGAGIKFIYYTYKDSNNCATTDSSYIKIHQAPVADAGKNLKICAGTSTNLVVSGGDFYLWNTNETTSEIMVAPLDTTVYTVIAYNYNSNNSFICTDTDSVFVYVIPLPEVVLTSNASNNVSSYGQEVTFTANPSSYDLYEFYVNDILVQSELINVYITSKLENDNIITVIAKDSLCISNPDSMLFRVKPISNAFTPNHDGKNDLFMKGYDLKIFNRWGQLLYEGITGWDGTLNGDPLPGGTYFYVTTIYTDDRQEVVSVIKGSVLLIRDE